MKKFSIIIPTRDRPILFHRAIEALWTHTTHKQDVEILVVCDNDDSASQKYVRDAMSKWSQLDINLLTRDRSEFSNKDYYNWAGALAQGDLIWCFADDLEMVKFNWDETVWNNYKGFKADKPDDIICIGVRDNTPSPSHRLPKFPCFPLFTRRARDFFGWLLHPAPPNWGVDYISYVIYHHMGRLIEINDDNYLNHICYHNKQVPSDETSMRIGRIFNKLKMRPEYSTDRVLAEECPKLRQKLGTEIEDAKRRKQQAELDNRAATPERDRKDIV